MPLYKITVTTKMHCGGGKEIPVGATVEVIVPNGSLCTPNDINEAFIRKYGIDPHIVDKINYYKKEQIK